MTGACEIADLVVLEARRGQGLDGDLVQFGFGLLVGEGGRLAREPARVRRPVLDREAVRRDVLYPEVDGGLSVRASSAVCPGTPNIRSIEMLVKPAVARPRDRGRDVGRRVPPAERAQLRRLERLDAERESVDSGRANEVQVRA